MGGLYSQIHNNFPLRKVCFIKVAVVWGLRWWTGVANGAGSKPSDIDILKVLTNLLFISYISFKYLINFLFVLLSFYQLLE